ncbi:MAG: hypothetical protein ACYTEL_05625 [Planctomycetota bacterium]|jgi:DNA-binding transcriptional regulator/RsmH inhibitor MraZ
MTATSLKTKKQQHSISFIGKYEVTVLNDRRIILPADIIRQLEGNGIERLLLGKFPGCKALVLCPEILWGKWLRKIRKKFPCLEIQDGARTFLIPWQPAKWDYKGRISLPRRARDYAGIITNSTVIIMGIDYYIELWAEEEFTKMTRECEIALVESVSPSLSILKGVSSKKG